MTPRGGAVVARWAHNPKVAGSSPAPATNGKPSFSGRLFSSVEPHIKEEARTMEVLYEDNHIIIVNKAPGEIVQGDKTGDEPLSETVKRWLKEKYAKPGNVFCGVVHRLDRPVSGVVIFAKTSKALSRLNEMLRKGEIHKRYYALVEGHREQSEATLEDILVSNPKLNKTFRARPGQPDAKICRLRYSTVKTGERYTMLEVELLTGRKHQIRAQLSLSGTPIKGDLKYGARRSNRDGNISLHARSINFIHPVSGKEIFIEAPLPAEMQRFLSD